MSEHYAIRVLDGSCYIGLYDTEAEAQEVLDTLNGGTIVPHPWPPLAADDDPGGDASDDEVEARGMG